MDAQLIPREISRRKIPAGGGFSVRLETGDRLRIIDTHGQQAVDFLCYSAELTVDRYNAANTMEINGNIYLEHGTKLYSAQAQVLMRVVDRRAFVFQGCRKPLRRRRGRRIRSAA